MKVEITSEWNETFFERLVDFRNRIQKDLKTSFPETVEDYKKLFGSGSPFESDYEWKAFIVTKGEAIVAKAILSWKKNGTTGNLGYIDWENNLEAAKFLVEQILRTGKEQQLKAIKTPVDLNFYVRYRIKLPGGGEPFWGEPVYPDYYHDLFKETGFNEIGYWDTYRIKKWQGILDYFIKRKKLEVKTKKSTNLRTTIRCVKLDDWENELKIIHSLFNEAYKNMPEWESISFEQFRFIYDDFKYIMNPYYSYIVELKGKPVGFSINFVDPLNVLCKVKGKKLSMLQKGLLLLKLRANIGTYLIAHIGKIPGPNGEDIKGVQIQVSKRIQVISVIMPKILVTFQMKDSPSRRSFEQKTLETYSEYVLYGRDL